MWMLVYNLTLKSVLSIGSETMTSQVECTCLNSNRKIMQTPLPSLLLNQNGKYDGKEQPSEVSGSIIKAKSLKVWGNWLWSLFSQSGDILIEVSHLYHLPPVWLQPSHLTILHLSFLMCEEEELICIKLSTVYGTLLINAQLTVAFSDSHENDGQT